MLKKKDAEEYSRNLCQFSNVMKTKGFEISPTAIMLITKTRIAEGGTATAYRRLTACAAVCLVKNK